MPATACARPDRPPAVRSKGEGNILYISTNDPRGSASIIGWTRITPQALAVLLLSVLPWTAAGMHTGGPSAQRNVQVSAMPALSVVVPTFNEAENVEPLVARVTRALADVDFELIIVDDSTDGTDRVLADIARGTPRLRAVHRTDRRGLASAVADGIQRATGDVVVVLDADLQHPPEAVPVLCDALCRTGADLAIASRYVPGGNDEFTPARRFVSRVATAIARVLLGRARSVADPLSGFFAFRRSVVEGVRLQPVGYKILLEILVRGHVSRIVEVPYRFEIRGKGASKLTLVQHLEFLKHLLMLSAICAHSVPRVIYHGRSEAFPR